MGVSVMLLPEGEEPATCKKNADPNREVPVADGQWILGARNVVHDHVQDAEDEERDCGGHEPGRARLVGSRAGWFCWVGMVEVRRTFLAMDNLSQLKQMHRRRFEG